MGATVAAAEGRPIHETRREEAEAEAEEEEEEEEEEEWSLMEQRLEGGRCGGEMGN